MDKSFDITINFHFAVEDSCVKENYDFGGADIRMVKPSYQFSNYQCDATAWASESCEIYAEYQYQLLKSLKKRWGNT